VYDMSREVVDVPTHAIVNIFSLVPLLFTIYLAKRHLAGSRQNWYYILASIITIVILLLEVLETLLTGRDGVFFLLLHHLAYSAAFSLTPAIPLVILFYLGFSSLSFQSKLLISLPFAANAILSVLSIQNGWIFTISEANIYLRGPLFLSATFISAAYYLLILLSLKRLKATVIVPSHLLLGMVYFLPIVSTLYQLLFNEEIFIFSTVAIALMLYYLIMQEASFDYDLQTKVRNRVSFEHEMQALAQKPHPVALYIFDVNNLKQTNDAWGHQEGDVLLSTIAELLTQVFGGKGKVFRVGGDEFSVLIDTQKASDCSVLLQRFKALVAHTNESRVPPISIASGYACIDPANNISLAKAFHLADDAMYRDKMEQKQKLRQ